MPDFFQLPYIPLFLAGLVFLLAGNIAFFKKKEAIALVLLTGCALLVRAFMALQDPFLHTWDEQFHVLVARNMMDAPFKPMLVKYPITLYDPHQWTFSHVWLHKQPLFLWQMALSMKLLGPTIFAARLPSAIMGALMCPMLYSITKRAVNDRWTGWIAAVVFCFCGFHLEQISGLEGSDHNDVAFGFYVLASVWAYARYTEKRDMKHAVLVGALAGAAVLIKWLTGLVIFAGWGANMLLKVQDARKPGELKRMAVAALAAFITFLPWQVYIFQRFPREAGIEMELNNRHLKEAVEGHEGTIFYYIDKFPRYFGEVGWPLVIAGFAVLLLYVKRKNTGNREVGMATLTTFSAIFIFFSYVVPAKMPGFFFVAAPLAVMFASVACLELRRQVEQAGKNKIAAILMPVLVVAITISILNPDDIKFRHNPTDGERVQRTANARLYQRLSKLIPENVKIVMNTNSLDEIECMFFNNDKRVFSGVPDQKYIDSFNTHHVPFAAFASRPGYELPDYVTKSPQVIIISDVPR